ncbi:MAG: RNA polymerase sigma factor [Myxococcota bacterium]
MSIDVERAYREYGDIVYRRARTLVGEEEAMDVVQELFVSLLRNPGQFKGTSKLSTFLYSATTHACWNRLRNRRNRDRLHEEQLRPSLEEATAAAGETRAIVREVIGRVEAQLAEVAVYYYVDEMSHQEISEIVGCSRRQVGNLLARFHEELERLRRAS